MGGASELEAPLFFVWSSAREWHRRMGRADRGGGLGARARGRRVAGRSARPRAAL